jgi:hypothetical protein
MIAKKVRPVSLGARPTSALVTCGQVIGAEEDSPRRTLRLAARADLIGSALQYASRGWTVFPACVDAKKSYKCAALSNGTNWGATSDPAEIRKDFSRWPNCRIGIPTGAGNDIVVAETDTLAGHGVDGSIALRELEAKYGALPPTLQAISPTGSVHSYFGHPGGIKIKTTASVIGHGVDIRADGGMVIAPPSVNLDGRAYRWLNQLPIAAMPAWLIELTKEKPRTISERAVAAITPPCSASNAYASAALRYEIDNILQAQPGHRNATLNKAGFALGQLVVVGLLDEAEVARLLFEAAAPWGDHNKDRNVIRYAMQAGMRHPRSRSGRLA